MIRLAPVPLLALTLGACTPAGREAASGAQGLDAYAVAAPPAARAPVASGSQAIAVLPAAAGAVERVEERRFRGGLHQEVMLRGEGRQGAGNRISVTLMGATPGSLDDEPGGAAKPTEAGIRSELATRLPGVPMRVVDRERRNAYGVYGLAVGRAPDGARCIYAWQWIASLRGSNTGADPVSLRVRLCRDDLSLDQLAAQVEQVRIEPARLADRPRGGEREAGLDAVADRAATEPRPAAGGAARGRRAAASRPVARAVRPAAPSARAAATPRRGRPDEGWAGPVAADQEGIGADGRRYLAPAAGAAVAPAASAASGPSFGPPVAGPARSGGARAYDRASSPEAGPGPAAPARAPSLDPSLPAQAYLGPGAGGRARQTP